MLYHDRTDAFKDIGINKTSASLLVFSKQRA